MCINKSYTEFRKYVNYDRPRKQKRREIDRLYYHNENDSYDESFVSNVISDK